MVELIDGSVIAQLGVTDMRLPIQYAFSYPERWAAPLPSLDLARAGRLEFEPPDTARFPVPAIWRAARCAGSDGLPIVLNAANEIAVAAFLDDRLPFMGIPAVDPAGDGRVRARRARPRSRSSTTSGRSTPGPGVRRPRDSWATIYVVIRTTGA